MKPTLFIAISAFLVISGCFGGDSTIPIGSGLDQINAYTCECSFETSDRPVTDTAGNEGIIVMFDEDDATEAASGAVAVYVEDLVMEGGSWVGVRFREIPIPRYSVIKSAHVEFTAAAQGHDPTNVNIWVENSTNTNEFLEVNGNVSSRTLTVDAVDWSLTDWQPNQKYSTPDFAPLVQEVVNNDEWVGDESSSLVVVFETIDGLRNPMSSETGEDTAPKLLIVYAPIATAALDVCLGDTIDRCAVLSWLRRDTS